MPTSIILIILVVFSFLIYSVSIVLFLLSNYGFLKVNKCMPVVDFKTLLGLFISNSSKISYGRLSKSIFSNSKKLLDSVWH